MKGKASYIILLIIFSTICTVSASERAQACYCIPPNIKVLSPENRTYATDSIPLIFTLNEPTSWNGYSLDGHANITVLGNDTLTNLLDGTHNVLVYANDTGGNMGVSDIVHFMVDTTPPDITDVVQMPSADNVLPDDDVDVNATVTDILSEVVHVVLNYTNGNGTWISADMVNLEGDVWGGTIPKFDYGTWVNYTISAWDEVGNFNTSEEIYGYQYQYNVIPEFTSLIIFLLLMSATLLAALAYRRNSSSGAN